MTRTENSTKNMYTGIIYQVLVLLFRFVTRTIFIQCLGKEYLGINGLFSNILTLLSLADLGISGALVYALYEPIAKNDIKRQQVIIKYLKNFYLCVGGFIMLIGIVLLPFIKTIVKDDVNFVNLYIVFFIYVFQTASSYLFFPSKTEFLCANQKRYIYNNIANIFVVISNIIQIVVLLVFKNFYIYLIAIIIFNILQYAVIAIKTNKMYPFIKEKCVEKLSKEEKNEILKDCGSLIIYRINYVVLTATDNIIISKYLGLAVVGLYSNYVLITNSIVNVLSTLFDSITASIGNLHALKDKNKDYFIFNLTNFLTSSLFGVFAVGVCVLANEFIELWLGKDYLLSNLFVIIISINLYIEGIRKFLSTYRTTYGLFRQAKFMPLLGMIVNIVVSVILVKKIGIFGVLLGTLISNLISFMWYDPYIIYKNVFKDKVIKYYIKNILYFLFFVVMTLICKYICSLISISGIIGFIIHGIICVSLPSIIILVMYYNTNYGKYFREYLSKFIKKGRRNNG